jgi:hypothetical protein
MCIHSVGGLSTNLHSVTFPILDTEEELRGITSRDTLRTLGEVSLKFSARQEGC